MEKYLHLLSRGDKIGLTLIRLSIAIVFMWIGLLKFVPYEADSITPFVANSPLMSFFYEHPEDYKQYLTHEGEYKPEARAWQSANNTYGFSNGLGVVGNAANLL
ncbi:reactive chlorine species resistance protein RclC, partial [Escherichia coli]